MDYKISQALTDLKNFYGLKDFKEINLNMVDVEKPFIRFKSGDDVWVLSLKKVDEAERIHKMSEKYHNKIIEEGENGVL
tara:strand:+ start:462 stop:698 length:237 start_codon:yes stop_codon:yes gene_type:complete